MADPVSWLMIRPGWKVYAADGTDVGAVDEVAGDENADIFDGLAVARSAFAKPTYVPAESVGPITEGRIELTLTMAEVDALGEYLEPATSEVIEGDNKSSLGSTLAADVREIEGKAIHPVEHQRSFPLLRRLVFWLKRERG